MTLPPVLAQRYHAMMTSAAPDSAPLTGIAGFRALRRQLVEAFNRESPRDPAGGTTLEMQRANPDPPRVSGAQLLEHPLLRSLPVPEDPAVGFSAFLDGIQASRVLVYDEGIPIVYGSVAAVIRERTGRRLGTWAHRSEARVYAPLQLLAKRTVARITEFALDVVDTTPRRTSETDTAPHHPLGLADVAVNAAQAHRESLELALAESWCSERAETLYVDGGISSSQALSRSPCAVGVVKSHRTLYGPAADVKTILALPLGHRSSVFIVESPKGWRSPVASWYLRIRDTGSGDPLWGLVRVEVAPPASASMATERADEVSRWILAETAPLALPDSRWDTMVYGIRDCEQFLKSIHQ